MAYSPPTHCPCITRGGRICGVLRCGAESRSPFMRSCSSGWKWALSLICAVKAFVLAGFEIFSESCSQMTPDAALTSITSPLCSSRTSFPAGENLLAGPSSQQQLLSQGGSKSLQPQSITFEAYNSVGKWHHFTLSSFGWRRVHLSLAKVVRSAPPSTAQCLECLWSS